MGNIGLGLNFATGIIFSVFLGPFSKYLLHMISTVDPVTLNPAPNEINILKYKEEINWGFYTNLEPLVDFIADNSPYKTENTSSRTVKLTSKKKI
ncbi:MAG: hypothetical protein ACK5H1_07270 [Tenacibaculum sp.]